MLIDAGRLARPPKAGSDKCGRIGARLPTPPCRVGMAQDVKGDPLGEIDAARLLGLKS